MVLMVMSVVVGVMRVRMSVMMTTAVEVVEVVRISISACVGSSRHSNISSSVGDSVLVAWHWHCME